MTRLTYVLLSGALVLGLALAGAACTDDDGAESNSNASQQSVDDISARVQRNEMMHAIIELDSLGLHDMDETLNGTGEIDPSFAPKARTAVRLLALTDWGSHQADADAAHEQAVALLQALEDEDVEAAADAASGLHDLEHDLSAAVWNELAADLPPDAGGPQEHDGGSRTPEPGATEAHDEPETPAATEDAE